jgi:hypothetical protein
MMAGQEKNIYSVPDRTHIAHTLHSETAHIHTIIGIGVVIIVTVNSSADLLPLTVTNGTAGSNLHMPLPCTTGANTVTAQTFTSDVSSEVSGVHGFTIMGDH